MTKILFRLLVLGLQIGLTVGLSPLALAQDESTELDREPSAVIAPSATKRLYPGGADEEDLQVQARLPEALIKTDARTLQRDVYRGLFKQEMKEERRETEEE